MECAANIFSITQGNAKTMYLKAVNASGCNSDPLDLTSCTEVDVALPKSDGTYEHLLKSEGDVTISSPTLLGKFTVPISAELSALLLVGEYQDFDVTFTIGSNVFTVRYQKSLSIFQSR